MIQLKKSQRRLANFNNSTNKQMMKNLMKQRMNSFKNIGESVFNYNQTIQERPSEGKSASPDKNAARNHFIDITATI